MPSTNNFQWSDFWQNLLNGAVKVCDLPIFSKEGSPPESYARGNRKPPELRCTRLPKDQEAYSPNSVQDFRTWTDLQAEDRLLQYFVKAYSIPRECGRSVDAIGTGEIIGGIDEDTCIPSSEGNASQDRNNPVNAGSPGP